MKEQNAYKRHQAYLDRVKVVASGKIWVATKTQIIIEIPHGWIIYPLRQD